MDIVLGVPQRVVLAGLRIYKLILSPVFAGSCRYMPSCSEYTADAVRVHGAVKGLALGTWRLLRCHPFGGNGIDPVPMSSAAWRSDCRDPEAMS